jgi:hypothetical protein
MKGENIGTLYQGKTANPSWNLEMKDILFESNSSSSFDNVFFH